MAFAGWLVQDGRNLVIPNFDRHNGKTAKDRGLTAKRVAKNKAKGNAGANVGVTLAPLPDALPREEKRREEEKQEQGAIAPAPKKSRKREAVTFAEWTASLPADVDAIPGDDPVFAYADRVGLPRDFIALEWAWFEAKYSGASKAQRYADWRQTFRNAVEGGWGNLWRVNASGEYLSLIHI